jgi:CBS-domain-containing membrane protein
MSPRTIAAEIFRRSPLLRTDQEIGDSVQAIVAAELPALPVVTPNEKLYGIFGEREFIGALYPGYLGELHYAGFVPDSIDDVIEKRIECARDPVSKYANTERIAAGPGHSDAQIAETFLHHRVLIIPIIDADDRVTGIVTRWEFFKALAERLTATR